MNQKPKRIVHIIGQLIPGGVEKRTLELVEASDETEFVHYVYVTSGLRGSMDNAYEKAGATIIYQNIKSVSFAPSFYRFLRANSISAVHSYIMHSSGYVLAIARAAGVKNRIVHFRSDGQAASELRGTSRVLRSVKSLLVDCNATTIAGLSPTNLAAAWKRNWRQDSRCVVLSNGIKIPELHELRSPVDFTIEKNKRVILHVGRGELPTKNRDKAITIMAELVNTSGLNVQLVFLGRDGRTSIDAKHNRVRWDNLARRYGVSKYITYAGERSDVMSWMLASDALLFTSTLEGSPGVVLEARAAGLPIVASNLPGVQYIGETFPDIRILSPNAADEEWAEAVRNSLEMSSENKHERQREFWASRYNFEHAFDAYKQLWSL